MMNSWVGTSTAALERWALTCRAVAVATLLAAAYLLVGSIVRILLQDIGWIQRGQYHLFGLLGVDSALQLINIPSFMLIPPLLAWGVAQYLDFLSGASPAPGWFARILHKVLFVYAALYLLGAAIYLTYAPIMLARQNAATGPGGLQIPVVYNSLIWGIPHLAYALFYFGLADLIRRSRRYVEEARLTI